MTVHTSTLKKISKTANFIHLLQHEYCREKSGNYGEKRSMAHDIFRNAEHFISGHIPEMPLSEVILNKAQKLRLLMDDGFRRNIPCWNFEL